MDFITINNRQIATANISTIDVGKIGVTESNRYEVVIRMNNSQPIQAFSGTKSACDDYVVGLNTAIGGVIKPIAEVNWADFNPSTITVEKGKVNHTEMLWNGEEAESALFTYEQTDMAIAEFLLGEVIGFEVGETAIAANKSGKKAVGRVIVVPSKDGIEFEHPGASLAIGESVVIRLMDANGVGVPWSALTLHSSKPDVATVANGQVEAVAEGVTFIIADYLGNKYGYSVHVRPAEPPVEPTAAEKKVVKKKAPQTKKKAE